MKIRDCIKIKIRKCWTTTSRTTHVKPKPLVYAFHMEIVTTGQPTNLHHIKMFNVRLKYISCLKAIFKNCILSLNFVEKVLHDFNKI